MVIKCKEEIYQIHIVFLMKKYNILNKEKK